MMLRKNLYHTRNRMSRNGESPSLLCGESGAFCRFAVQFRKRKKEKNRRTFIVTPSKRDSYELYSTSWSAAKSSSPVRILTTRVTL